jgi:two-component system sensor histidine kinase KdpD
VAEDGGRRGKLTIFLGYAAGVGKTYRMLRETQELKAQGHDIVIGYFEPHGRADTIAQTQGLETVPRRLVEYRGRTFEEMDADAVLARKPAICAVDEFPHTNVPGLARAKRWEDVVVLLEAGIDVLTTMNIQHLESLNDQVREISGIHVRETVPDWIVKEADEVVLVDLTPEALLNRLARGVVYSPEKATRALHHFFREPTLAALREMALRQTAHEVDLRQKERDAITAGVVRTTGPGAGEARERILIYVTESPMTSSLIRRGHRVADYLRAECFAVAVVPPAMESGARAAIGEHMAFARGLHIETRLLEAEDAATTVVDFARKHAVTQILAVKPEKRPAAFLTRRCTALRIVELAKDMQVMLVAERRSAAPRVTADA